MDHGKTKGKETMGEFDNDQNIEQLEISEDFTYFIIDKDKIYDVPELVKEGVSGQFKHSKQFFFEINHINVKLRAIKSGLDLVNL